VLGGRRGAALLELKRQKEQGHPIKLIVGSEFRLTCRLRFVALAPDRRVTASCAA
jgi:hypothetical protein